MSLKPIIEYRATKLPPPLAKPVVQMRDYDSYRNFHNKRELTDYIDSLSASPSVDSYMTLICGCGMGHEFVTKDEIPATNMVCDCGRQLIIYS
jgi:hypothetical protein